MHLLAVRKGLKKLGFSMDLKSLLLLFEPLTKKVVLMEVTTYQCSTNNIETTDINTLDVITCPPAPDLADFLINKLYVDAFVCALSSVSIIEQCVTLPNTQLYFDN